MARIWLYVLSGIIQIWSKLSDVEWGENSNPLFSLFPPRSTDRHQNLISTTLLQTEQHNFIKSQSELRFLVLRENFYPHSSTPAEPIGVKI